MGKKKIKLHIGCGNVYKRGYINIDAYNMSKADIKAKADKLPYKNNSVDKIENHHLLEHLDRTECDFVLKEWFRVLKPGAKLLVEVPDLIRNIEIFLRSSYHKRWENYRREFKHGRIQTIYGLGERKGQLHKSGFDKERLKKELSRHGFVNIRVFNKKGTPVKGENTIAVCQKPRQRQKLRKFRETIKNKSKLGQGRNDDLVRSLLRKTKRLTAYALRYLADSIEEIKFPNF